MARRVMTGGNGEEAGLSLAEFRLLLNQYWVPHLPELLAKELTVALSDEGKNGAEARKHIFDRLVGKPVEQVRQETKQTINIILRQVDSAEQPDILELEPSSVRHLSLTDGGLAADST